jgi:phytoene dehydrogenase-like protein
MAGTHVDVVLERGAARTFAITPAWPGWARSARTRDGDGAAIDALVSYAARYAVVAQRAGVPFPGQAVPRVVGGAPGTATTDFGATDVRFPQDAPASGAAARRDLERQVSLLRAAWAQFHEVAAAAPQELAKGPRGGGRDTRDIVCHVVESERSYVRGLGVKQKPFDVHDAALREAMREQTAAAILADDPAYRWPARYALRRIAWHVLDHLWEIEDKS